MKELLVAVAGIFAKRYTVREKIRFINYLGARLKENKKNGVVNSNGKKGRAFCSSVYSDNLSGADIVLSAPLDTLSKVLFPGYGYYPVNQKRNYREELLSIIFGSLLGFALAALYYHFVFYKYLGTSVLNNVALVAGMALVAFVSFRIAGGLPNKNNYSRNSSTLVILLEGLKRKSWKAATAFAFLDKGANSFEGYRMMAEYLGKGAHKKRFVLLDSLCAGDSIYVHYKEGTKIPVKKIGALKEFKVRLNKLPEEEAAKTILSYFPQAIYITGGVDKRGECVIKGTRCSGDNEVDIEKMEKLLVFLCKTEKILRNQNGEENEN
jgi:hypothetical protein